MSERIERGSGSSAASIAVALHDERNARRADRLSLQWGVVTAISNGKVILRPLAATDPADEEYAYLVSRLPVVGESVVYGLLGTSWIVLGVITPTPPPPE